MTHLLINSSSRATSLECQSSPADVWNDFEAIGSFSVLGHAAAKLDDVPIGVEHIVTSQTVEAERPIGHNPARFPHQRERSVERSNLKHWLQRRIFTRRRRNVDFNLLRDSFGNRVNENLFPVADKTNIARDL
jgi:hypothetical protein